MTVEPSPICWLCSSNSEPETPRATGICFITIVMPIDASIPLMTELGTSADSLPARSNPIANWIAPASTTAIRNGAMPAFMSPAPSLPSSSSTIEVRPAAGPDTDKGAFEMSGTRMPPQMPETMPETGGIPDAIAMPRHSGSATRNTTMPATESWRGVANME